MASKVKYSATEIFVLQQAFSKSHLTITRWIKAKNDILTSEKAVAALASIKNKPKDAFLKDMVYVIGGKRFRCALVDMELACLAPLVVRRNGNTSTDFTKAVLYSVIIDTNSMEDIFMEGKISKGVFIKF